MSANTYPIEQQVHALSLLTNAAFGEEFQQPAAGPCASPNAFDNLQSYVNTVVGDVLSQDQASGGDNYLGYQGNSWQCVWGPVVYSNNPNSNLVVADNVLALYYNSSSNSYVVGISGTNSVSTYGWVDEDFDVSSIQPWSSVNPATQAPAGSSISTGAQIGINILLGLQDKNNSNETMIAYLQKNLNASAGNGTLYVAGHSLGGALTHIMALYLYETVSTWNTGSVVKNIIAYPTAGPTITNQTLTTYYDGLVGASGPVTFSYIAKINPLDIVPMAWALGTLSTAPYIYDSYPKYQDTQTSPKDNMVAMITTVAIMKSYNTNSLSFNNYTQIWNNQCVILTDASYEPIMDIIPLAKTLAIEAIPAVFAANSTLSGSALTSGDYPNYLTNFLIFFIEAIYQHTTAYSLLLDISGFATEFASIKGTVPGPVNPSQTLHENVINKFVSRTLGQNLTASVPATDSVSVN